jgi:tetratricopeptide (TPR) repeat protein
VALFGTRAVEARPDFSAADTQIQADIAALVERVDGIPLAIELAAGWTSVMSPGQLLQRLSDGMEVLSTHPRGPDQTLQRVMTETWSRLDRWEQIALEQISAFQGGFSLDSLDAVLSLPQGYGAPDHLQLVGQLRDQSLVQMYEPPESPGQLRFRTYAVVRDFAEQRVRRSGRHATMWRRHATWALGLAEELAQGASEGDPTAVTRLALERDNLLAVADRYPRGREAIRAVLALSPLLSIRGPWTTWESRMERAWENTGRMGLRTRVEALIALADARIARGKPEAVVNDLEQLTEELAKGSRRMPKVEPEVHLRLARARLLIGEYDGALESASYAKSLSADPRHTHIAQAISARTHRARGNLDKARQLMMTAVDGLTAAGAARDEALYRLHLGDLLRTLGQPEPATEHYHRAMSLHEVLRDGPRLAMSNHRLGTLKMDLGDLKSAQTHLTSAVAMFKEIGNRRSEAMVRGDLGRLEQLSRRPREALTLFRRAQRTLAELGDRRFHALYLASEGSLQHELGRWDDARRAVTNALDILEGIGDTRFSRLISLRLGALEADAGDRPAAMEAFRRADTHVPQGIDPVGSAAAEVHRVHLVCMTEPQPAIIKRTHAQFEGTIGTPGIAQRSADVRLALQLLQAHAGKAQERPHKTG